MNTLKYILSILFIILILFFGLEAKSFFISEEVSNTTEYNVVVKNSGQAYNDLVYSVENDKVAITSYSSVYMLDFSFRESSVRVDAWGVLNIDAVLRKNPGDLEKLSHFIQETLFNFNSSI